MNENLSIDPAQLDEEWLSQPLYFDQAQQDAAEAMTLRDELKDKLAWLEADRGAYIHAQWKKEGFEKPPTAPMVSAWVVMRPEIGVLREDLREANHNLNLANNTVRSFEMRKSALSKLTDLHISNYFSVPNPNHMLDGGKRFVQAQTEKAEENADKATAGLNEKKAARKKRTKKEVLEDIKDPGVKEALEKEVEKTEQTPTRRRRRG